MHKGKQYVNKPGYLQKAEGSRYTFGYFAMFQGCYENKMGAVLVACIYQFYVQNVKSYSFSS